MSNKEEQIEEVEIVIITDEQVDALPQKAVATVRSLKGSLPHAQLQIFIPVVQKYIELREMASKLKLERDENGEIKKECIESYKEVKKSIGSFNGDLKREIKKIKDPLNSIKSDVISVENTFKEESDEIKEAVLEEFKEYEDAETKRKEEAKKKKDAALLAQIEEANEETEALKLQQDKMNIYNEIRVNRITKDITDATADALDEMNELSLERLKAGIAQKTWETITANQKVELLDEDVQSELITAFDKAKQRAIASIDDKLQKYEDEREKEVTERVEKTSIPPAPSSNHIGGFGGPSIPPPPSPEEEQHIQTVATNVVEIHKRSEPDFIKYIVDKIAAYEMAVDIKVQQDGATPGLVTLKNRFVKFNSEL